MRAKVWAGVLTPVVLIGGAGAYAWADAEDMVPGWITAAPEPVAPAPFLSAAPVSVGEGPDSPVAPVDADAPIPDAAAVQRLAEAVRADSRTGTSTNVSVVDVVSGEVLADVSAGESQVPASTTKLLTVVAALRALGADYQTRTAVTWDAASARLTLIAGGDMMLAADEGHAGERTVPGRIDLDPNGWAGLGDLADQAVAVLTDAGVTEVNVAVDDSAFPAPPLNPEWPSYALNRGYVAPVTGLAVNIAKVDDEEYAQRQSDPSLAAAAEFAARLDERGIAVDRVLRADSPSGAAEVGAVESAPLSLVVEYLLQYSDNAIAEQVGLVNALETRGEATPAAAAAATSAQLAALGVDTSGLRLYDSAGFSTRNRITPRQLTQALVLSRGEPATAGLYDWLGIAGVEGTLGERYLGTDVAGLLRGKTGSLTGVTALTGVVPTADGRLLAFAVLADGMPYGQERPRSAIDEFVAALAGCGCDG